MIKNEIRSLRKNKILLVVVIAIIAIPFIYAGLFLKSIWESEKSSGGGGK